MDGSAAVLESELCFRAQFEAAAHAADALPPPRAQFHDSMTSALNAASSVLVIGRCSLPLHALLHPDHPALLGTMLYRPSLGRCSLQRKRFSSDGRLRLQLPLVHPTALPCLYHQPQWARYGAA